MKIFIKKNIIGIFAFTLGIILSITIVKATIYINGSNVAYSNNKLTSTNISDAIDELYTVSKTKKKITAWEYHETGVKKCINGEEDTCVSTECYKSGSTCSQGTVIKYYVNDNLYHYFYVLRDNGTTITMQQRENTVRNIPWASKYDYVASGGDGAYYDSVKDRNGLAGSNDKGPVTILNALEKVTSTWTNVNVVEYTPGTTTLYENAYTGCTYSGGSEISGYIPTCGTNIYTLPARKARARIITALEASSTGCLVWKDGSQYTNIMGNSINAFNDGSCPDFMHNYLYQSTTYGGSYNDNTQNENGVYNYEYWTMSAHSDGFTSAFHVTRYGHLSYSSVANTNVGARAVVEITKSNI